MAKVLVPDELWALVEPLLPRHAPSPKGGHPRVADRVCLGGILFVLKTGLPWEDFPAEMGCCGMTPLNRVREWQAAGVWQRLHETLLARLRGEGKIDFDRVVVDASHVRAPHGGKKTGPSPADRAKRGSKRHLIVDARGTPLATALTAGNVNEVTQRLPLVEAVPAVKGKAGAALRKPTLVMGDRGYDSDPHRMALSCKGIATRIARRRTHHGSGLGTFRYVVEQTIALFHQFRRLLVRHDRDDKVHEAFMSLACSHICWRRLDAATG